MGRPDLRKPRVEFGSLSRASTLAIIAQKRKEIAAFKPLTRRKVRAGRGSQGVFFRREGNRSFNQRRGIDNAQKNRTRKTLSSGLARIKKLDFNEKKVTRITREAREDRSFTPGASAAALARAKRRGQTTTVKRTAARRGRGKEVITKIAAVSCTTRPNQSVSLLTRDEAACEFNSAKIQNRKRSTIGGRRIAARQGGIKLNEREARLLVKAAQGKRSSRRVGRGRRARTVTSFSGGRSDDLQGFSSGLLSQAKAGLSVLDFLKAPGNFETETLRVGSRSSGEIVKVRRLKKSVRQNVNVIRSRGSFLLSGGTNREFDAILTGDIRNRQSGRGAVQSVSRGRVVLNRSKITDPFFGRR